MELNILRIVSQHECFSFVRNLSWPDDLIKCIKCNSLDVIKNGHRDTEPEKQRYYCKSCHMHFDNLSGTIFEGHYKPLKVCVVCSYLMGLNLSNAQIGLELDISESEIYQMTNKLRGGINEKKQPIKLNKEVEIDEAYIIAGHKGYPAIVSKLNRPQLRRRLKGARGRGTKKTEKPPVFGMIQRNGEVSILMLDNVQQKIIMPIILATIEPGSTIFTDEYSIYSLLVSFGFNHKTVNHSAGEYARDEDVDGFCEVHVNTMEGFWSLLRSWLRPHRGISQEKLPIYLGFFEFVHNVRKSGKSVIVVTLGALVTT